MTLSQLLEGVRVTKMFQTMYGKMVTTHDVKVSGLQYDSRKVQRGNVFVALRGTDADGHQFISSAIHNGAAVVVIENDNAVPDAMCMHTGVVKIVVENSRKALAEMSANYYGRPADAMTVIGVTGTNGKTTTTYLIRQMLEAAGKKVGMLGTVEYIIGEKVYPATHTTPESLEVHKMFFEMKNEGCTHVVMETSSHALHQYRVHGIPFAAAVFTNLTQDHLDYHTSMEKYFQAKKILFDGLRPESLAIVNADSEYGNRIVSNTAATVHGYSITSVSDLQALDITLTMQGFSLTINNERLSVPLIGRFNVYNFLAAASTVYYLERSWDVVLRTADRLKPAPGRFDKIHSKKGWTAVVDYAHTPDALENCLQTIHDILPVERKNKIITIFGAGGDRDKKKRPLMGAIAERLSDRVIVTSDNPRTEDPHAIIADIIEGITDKERAIIEADRRQAILRGVALADAGDIILLAGKGHENYQVIGKEKLHFDDKEEILAASGQ